MYRCLNCSKSIDIEHVKERVRCPYCGHRIIIKERPKTVVRVEAK
ncbi:MAG: DNA-directed RNA polymerase subunit P [Candidatus Aenigmatarchaeota archaeon]|nr:DNA-directed RNA polymerase subunit P [Candidatus Aenigmarchaeota archaeon]